MTNTKSSYPAAKLFTSWGDGVLAAGRNRSMSVTIDVPAEAMPCKRALLEQRRSLHGATYACHP
ncbi:MAG: hypothetical protein ACKVK3_14840 [Acidimicrobiales bacterium]